MGERPAVVPGEGICRGGSACSCEGLAGSRLGMVGTNGPMYVCGDVCEYMNTIHMYTQ